MKIRFPREITLKCVEILAVELEGEPCSLDMHCNVIFRAGQEYDGVECDEDTPTETRLWLRDNLVALDVKWSDFQILEF